MPVTDAEIAAKLVTYLRLEEVGGTDVRVDSSERGNNGTPINGPGAEDGKILKALSLDSALEQSLTLANGEDTRYNADDASVTICFWTKLHVNANPVPFVDKGPDDGYGEYAIVYSGGLFIWDYYVRGADSVSYDISVAGGIVDLRPDLQQRFVVATWSPGALRFRVDETITTGTGPAVPRITTDALKIGHAYGRPPTSGFASFLNGWIDEFMILKPGLTLDEEDYLWNGGNGRTITISPVQRLQFGDYVFPLGWKVIEDKNVRTVPISKLARAHGGRTQYGYLADKEITVEGGFYQGPLDDSDIRPRIDALRAALAEGPSNLYVYTDRFYRQMQAPDNPDTYIPTGFNRIQDSRITFRGPDPFQYDVHTIEDDWESPGDTDTRGLTGGGNADAQPAFTITVGGAGDVALDITLENVTTGVSFRLAGATVAGQVIVVDTLLQTVLTGSTDEIGLFDGQWPRLLVGANTLRLTVAGGSVASIVTTWRRRWL